MSKDETSNYSHSDIHFQMISDEQRTMAYLRAIQNNSDFFSGKVVLDIGSGTGILSMFAARAGASKVYSVECTPIAETAQKLIQQNHFEDKIEIIRGRMEEIRIPEKIDIIISEWMGYSLYYELMLPAVIFARDNYLKPDGKILPSKAQLYIAGGECFEYVDTVLHYWNDPYGLDMSPMTDLTIQEPAIDRCLKNQIVTSSSVVSSINLHDCTVGDQFFTAQFTLMPKYGCVVHAFILWFDVTFDDMSHIEVLSTAPDHPTTHWKQTFLYLTEELVLSKEEFVEGELSFQPNSKESTSIIADVRYRIKGHQDFKTQSFNFH